MCVRESRREREKERECSNARKKCFFILFSVVSRVSTSTEVVVVVRFFLCEQKNVRINIEKKIVVDRVRPSIASPKTLLSEICRHYFRKKRMTEKIVSNKFM